MSAPAHVRTSRGFRAIILACVSLVTSSLLASDDLNFRVQPAGKGELLPNTGERRSAEADPACDEVASAVGVAGTPAFYTLTMPGVMAASSIKLSGTATPVLKIRWSIEDQTTAFHELAIAAVSKSLLLGLSWANEFPRSSSGALDQVAGGGSAAMALNNIGADAGMLEGILREDTGPPAFAVDATAQSGADTYSDDTAIHRGQVLSYLAADAFSGTVKEGMVVNEMLNARSFDGPAATETHVLSANNASTLALDLPTALSREGTWTASASRFAPPPNAVGGTDAPAPVASYWDTNGISPGPGGNTPNGTWRLTSATWNASSDGTGPTNFWTDGNDAVFSASAPGNTATGSYQVTVSGPITANSITFKDGQIKLSGTGTPILTIGAGGVTLASTLSGTTTFDSSLNTVFLSASQNWRSLSGKDLVVASNLAAIGGPVTLTVNGSGGPGAETFSGVLGDGTGTLAFTIDTSISSRAIKTTTLSGVNTYSGDTTINAGGTLILGNAAAIPSGVGKGNVIVNGNLDPGNFNVVTVNGLSGTGNISHDGGGAGNVLQVGANNANSFFQGNIGHTAGGALGLTKIGTGSMVLVGNNVYNGDTTVNAGSLEIRNDGSTSAGRISQTDQVTVNPGALLLLSGAGTFDRINNSADVVLAGGTFAKGAGVIEGTVSTVGMGALDLTASGSKLDFTNSLGILSFVTFNPGRNVLTITGYMGNGQPRGVDQLIFDRDQSSDENAFDFGFGPGVNVAQAVLGGGFFEIYPNVMIPEPATSVEVILGLLVLGYTQRKRRTRLRKRAGSTA